jgi:hypothetical protein
MEEVRNLGGLLYLPCLAADKGCGWSPVGFVKPVESIGDGVHNNPRLVIGKFGSNPCPSPMNLPCGARPSTTATPR